MGCDHRPEGGGYDTRSHRHLEPTYGRGGAALRGSGLRFPTIVEGPPPNSSVAISPDALAGPDSDTVFDAYRNGEATSTSFAAEAMAVTPVNGVISAQPATSAPALAPAPDSGRGA